MIKENIAHLDGRLADLERTIRKTRHVISNYRKAQKLHQETTVLSEEADSSMATILGSRAQNIQTSYQNIEQVYSATEPVAL